MAVPDERLLLYHPLLGMEQALFSGGQETPAVAAAAAAGLPPTRRAEMAL